MIINAKKWLLLSVFQLNKPLFLFQCNHKSLQGFIWTCVDVDGGNYKPSGVGWFDFMWVSAVGPEYEQPVKQRLDVGDHVFVFRVDLQQASLFLPTHNQNSQYWPWLYDRNAASLCDVNIHAHTFTSQFLLR